MSRVYNVAITGFGKSARNFHVPLLEAHPGFQLRSVLLREESRTSINLKDVNVVRSLKELLKDDAVDLVIITTPNHLHFEQAREALQADKHVVVEKPITVTSESARVLIETASSARKALTVFHNRRWDSDFLTLRNIIKEKRIGEPLELTSSFNRFRKELRPGHWKEEKNPGSGILYDLSPHLIDQALLLFGNPDKLFADVRNQRGGETDDCFEIKLYYNSYPERVVTLKAGMLVPEPTPRFILRGTSGTVIFHDKDSQEKLLAKGKLSEVEHTDLFFELFHEKEGKIHKSYEQQVSGNYSIFYDELHYALQTSKEPPVFPNTAAKGIRIIEIALASSREKQVKEILWE